MKVEVAVLGSPSLIILNMVSVDVTQHLKKTGTASPRAVSVCGIQLDSSALLYI